MGAAYPMPVQITGAVPITAGAGFKARLPSG
jgi:hypothetical protein